MGLVVVAEEELDESVFFLFFLFPFKWCTIGFDTFGSDGGPDEEEDDEDGGVGGGIGIGAAYIEPYLRCVWYQFILRWYL